MAAVEIHYIIYPYFHNNGQADPDPDPYQHDTEPKHRNTVIGYSYPFSADDFKFLQPKSSADGGAIIL